MDPYMAVLEGLQRQDAGEIHGTNEVENHLRLWDENGAKNKEKRGEVKWCVMVLLDENIDLGVWGKNAIEILLFSGVFLSLKILVNKTCQLGQLFCVG